MLVDGSIKDIRFLNGGITKVMGENEILWEFPQDDKIGAPGNRTLLAGNMDAGWFGEVPSSDFITGDELAKVVGLTAGVSQYSDEPWLKFAYKKEVCLVAKKPFRHSISWNDINTVNAVYGDRVIRIKGKKYAVMLMRGIDENRQPDPRSVFAVTEGSVNHNSMWNRLMLPIHKNAPSYWNNSDNVKSPTENWNVGYSNADLLVQYTFGKGACSICQESVSDSRRVLERGLFRVFDSYWTYKESNGSNEGWRPVLKIIG